MSESDYPFEVVRWGGEIAITSEYLHGISGAGEASEIVEIDLDTFFGAYGHFEKLWELLKDNLSDLQVYKVGVISIAVYIVGRSPEGNWLGLSTRLIQT